MSLNKILMLSTMMTAVTACTPSLDETVDRLYDQMTLEEKIAQLHGNYLTDFFTEDGQLDTLKCEQLLANGAGHFSQFAVTQRKTPDELRDQVAQMQDWLMHHTRLGIPALFHEEVLTGVAAYEAAVYPQQIGQACSFNTELAERKTYLTANNMRQIGGYLALSPMVDVVRNPSFNRLEESYGEDNYLSAAMGLAFVRGLQHNGDMRTGIAACTKHFLGYGGGGDAPVKERMEEILMPHEVAIRLAGSRCLMTGYHAVDGTKAVANKDLQEDLLRGYLGYRGLTVSDYGSIEQNEAEADMLHQAAAAMNAGNDVDFPKGTTYSHIPEALEAGLIDEARLEQAVKNVLRLKAELGMLDKQPKLYAEGHIEWNQAEEQQLSYDIASQSVVLLQNNGVLPLDAPKKVALVGPNANSMWAMLGDYTYHSMRYFWQRHIEDALHPRIYTLREGLSESLPQGSELLYSRGCDWTEEVETTIEDGGDERAAYMRSIQERKIDSGEEANREEALKLAQESDVIVAAMGENVILCGENRDRKHLRLPGSQEQFVEQLLATGKPVVLVVFGGRAQVISRIADRCAAIVEAWYPGEMGGKAVADILTGRVNPSGKLSVSYPAEEVHEPICYNYSEQQDSRVAWPFGYGLSYTQFAYSNLRMPASARTTDEGVDITLDVTNTGEREGDEIVQLYVSPLERSAKLKPMQLQGFCRVHLLPGETKTVSLRLYTEQLGYYIQRQWAVDGGRYMIKIGAGSQDIRMQQELHLEGEQHLKMHREYYFSGVK